MYTAVVAHALCLPSLCSFTNTLNAYLVHTRLEQCSPTTAATSQSKHKFPFIALYQIVGFFSSCWGKHWPQYDYNPSVHISGRKVISSYRGLYLFSRKYSCSKATWSLKACLSDGAFPNETHQLLSKNPSDSLGKQDLSKASCPPCSWAHQPHEAHAAPRPGTWQLPLPSQAAWQAATCGCSCCDIQAHPHWFRGPPDAKHPGKDWRSDMRSTSRESWALPGSAQKGTLEYTSSKSKLFKMIN